MNNTKSPRRTDFASTQPVVRDAASAKPELLFILGPSFSGSTLLTFLLASHPEIATIGELKASALGDLSVYRCSCGELLEECEFWRNLQSDLQRRGASLSFENFGTHFVRGPRLFRRLIRLGVHSSGLALLSEAMLRVVPAWRGRRERILERNRLLVELITAHQGRRVFLDGSKDPEQLRQLLNGRLWKVKVLHLQRDGRGVANSYIKHHQVGMKAAARALLRTERACRRAISGIDAADILTVKYEEVCRDPRSSMNRIFAFAGLPSLEASEPSENTQLHILGNAMRLNPDKSIKHDEKWKSQLRPEELNQFNALCGSYNWQRGYR